MVLESVSCDLATQGDTHSKVTEHETLGVIIFNKEPGKYGQLALVELRISAHVKVSIIRVLQMFQTLQFDSHNHECKKCSPPIKNIQYIYSRHQHNTDDDGQAMGEELRHVQMSR